MKKITILFFQKLKQLGSNVNEAKSKNNQKKKKKVKFLKGLGCLILILMILEAFMKQFMALLTRR